MHAPDPVVDQSYVDQAAAAARRLQVPDDLRAESIVAKEQIADPGDQYLRAHPGSLRSSPRWVPVTCAGPTPGSLVSLSGI